jgi:hypothetical protein
MLSFTGNRLFDCLLLICLLVVATKVVAAAPDPLPGPSVSADQSDRLLAVLDATNLQKHIRYLTSDLMESRSTGSQGEDLTAVYLARSFQQNRLLPWVSAGLDDYLQPFSVPMVAGQTLAGKNVVACWPGQNRDQFLLISAHYDVTQNADNAPAVAIALELGHCLSASGQRPKRTVVIALVGGETQQQAGAQALVSQLNEQQAQSHTICLDLELTMDGGSTPLLVVDSGQRRDGNRSDLARRVQGELERMGLPTSLTGPGSQPANVWVRGGMPTVRLQTQPPRTKIGAAAAEPDGDVDVWAKAVSRVAWVMANW